MGEESVVNGVRVWRPLIEHTKAPVLEFAHTFGVPYFKDTTPLWSTRGKLRNQLVPLLREMYGEGFLGHLTSEDRWLPRWHARFLCLRPYLTPHACAGT